MMKLNCPVCKAENGTPNQCRRCKADLALLWAVERQRAAHLCAARTALEQGNFDDALDALDQAAALRASPQLRHWRACVFLLAQDFETATECGTPFNG